MPNRNEIERNITHRQRKYEKEGARGDACGVLNSVDELLMKSQRISLFISYLYII
jgi:hypothetical protein